MFQEVCNHKEIKKSYLPYLRFLNLSKTNFNNAKIAGLDLSYTNIENIDFSHLYFSIDNTNLEGVVLFGCKLDNISAQNANLKGTYLEINEDTTNLAGAKLDQTIRLTSKGRVIDASKQGYDYSYYKARPKLTLQPKV